MSSEIDTREIPQKTTLKYRSDGEVCCNITHELIYLDNKWAIIVGLKRFKPFKPFKPFKWFKPFKQFNRLKWLEQFKRVVGR